LDEQDEIAAITNLDEEQVESSSEGSSDVTESQSSSTDPGEESTPASENPEIQE